MSDCPSNYNGPERRDIDRRTPVCQYSEDSAKKAVRDVFAILGVDVERPEQVREFQESLRFGDFLKKAANKSVFAVVSTIVAAVMLALWYGAQTLITRQ